MKLMSSARLVMGRRVENEEEKCVNAGYFFCVVDLAIYRKTGQGPTTTSLQPP